MGGVLRVVYIFVVMELASRRIVHLNVSESPGLAWVKQQMRDAAPVGEEPKYLIHGNDGIFGRFGKRRRVEGRDGIREKTYRCHIDWWLDEVMDIKGISTPYGAPNANSRLTAGIVSRPTRSESFRSRIPVAPKVPIYLSAP